MLWCDTVFRSLVVMFLGNVFAFGLLVASILTVQWLFLKAVGSSVYIETAQSCPKSWGICRIYPSYFRTDVYLLYGNIHQQPPKALNERSHLSCWPTAQWLVSDFARWFTAKNAVSGCVGCIRFTRAWGKDVQRLFCSLNGAVWRWGGSEVKRIIYIYVIYIYIFIFIYR